MSTYLLEIGTEELPAKFAETIVNQFKSLIEFDLNKNFIKYEKVFCSSTPRRIVLMIFGLIDKGEDKIEFRKGPKAESAFNNGSPTNAAKGFAKSLNISIEDLQIKNTDKGDFVFGEKIEKGQLAKDLLSIIVPKVLKSLQGQRFMKWGFGNFKFSRPIRWIVSLYNSDLLDFSLKDIDNDLEIGNISRGHRLFKNKISIIHPDSYISLLEDSGVIVKRDVRKEFILNQIKNTSNKLALYPDLPDPLINELTDLVEFPNLILGEFDKSFLSLPAEVLCTVMKSHQRYIPLFKVNENINKLQLSSENILSTKFLCVSNGLSAASDLIQRGNENVLRARFADAKFFIASDKKFSCEERNLKIKNISFMKGLGSLSDRVNRIEFISEQIFNQIKDNDINLPEILQAARLSKHDLCSEIVYEFPELQGVMGGKYLKNEGYSENISLAVSEHYLPRFNKDDLPSTKYGSITSISDKFETIISLFISGKRPSGSSDPYALRRNLNGIIQIAWNFNFDIKFDVLVSDSLDYWKENINETSFNYEDVSNEILEFIKQRVLSYLEEISIKKDIINSIYNSKLIQKSKLLEIYDLKNRISTINNIKSNENHISIINIISRYSKLAGKGNLDTNIYLSENLIKPNLFEKISENEVLNLIKKFEILISKSNWKYNELIDLFVNHLDILNDLFDINKGVMIMSEDLSVRENRLNLISLIRNYSLLLCDFTLLNS